MLSLFFCWIRINWVSCNCNKLRGVTIDSGLYARKIYHFCINLKKMALCCFFLLLALWSRSSAVELSWASMRCVTLYIRYLLCNMWITLYSAFSFDLASPDMLIILFLFIFSIYSVLVVFFANKVYDDLSFICGTLEGLLSKSGIV